ncbi:NADH dehydrogenase [ubiquinone] 1 alpha subcomplex assembly factor 3 [Paramyrothecium foliicola]|nr:NADH dehydrogenase [ubiquinone] 1 alpha subcomplex assembly factor 3 [Paramyrothecium foliicola]
MRSFIRTGNGRSALRTFTATVRPTSRCIGSPAAQTLQSPLRLLSRSFHASIAQRKRQNVPDHPPPTNFGDLDVLGNTPPPATSVDVCMSDGFGLNSGVTITDGNGALLVNGEAFVWRPWEAKGSMELANKKGQFELPAEAFGVFDLIWPRPDLLIIGVGKSNMPLSPQTRKCISDLGMRVEMLDTRNAASQFNLLATERGVSEVAAALIPIGWEDGVGAKE